MVRAFVISRNQRDCFRASIMAFAAATLLLLLSGSTLASPKGLGVTVRPVSIGPTNGKDVAEPAQGIFDSRPDSGGIRRPVEHSH